MAKFCSALDTNLISFIQAQRIFFTGSAPAAGRINVSPKGMDSFAVISPQEVAYLDLTGSGNETAAHIKQNGRLTIMFCSFAADPLILRLYGKGFVVRRQDELWEFYRPFFPSLPGERQIIGLRVESVQTSCGYAVPEYTYQGERPTLMRWAQKKGPAGLLAYWREKNQTSIDGLPSDLLTPK